VAQRAGRARLARVLTKDVRTGSYGLAGNGLFPATSPIVVPVAVGYRDAVGGGELDAFLAMTASGRRVRRVRPARERPPTLREAADAFLAQPDLAASSYRSYAQTLGQLGRDLGPERPLEWVSGREGFQ
jgi:hypothetical protein